jgi:hypothetical protein
MRKVAEMLMSLGGIVADAADGVAEVFACHGIGEVAVPTASSQFVFRV